MSRRLAAALVAVLPLLAAPTAQAAEPGYSMTTVTHYAVDPAAGEIVVSVEVVFTNTTPNPPGQVSGFDRVDLGVHPGASDVAARDGRGALVVDLAERDGVEVASVRPRARIRYDRSVSFTLTYRLADGSAPGVHVRPEVVRFAAWGFGTSSAVTIEMPSGYDARADGDPMVIDTAGPQLRMASGPIADPASWLALVTATTPIGYAGPLTASVALASGTVDLQVRAWVGDSAWGERTMAILEAGLPRLEAAIGLPYPRVGPLVVSEVVGSEASPDQVPLPTADLWVAFDADAFTLLHEAAHIWIDDQLAADRWLREGLASHEAAVVATALGEALPYDPAARASALSADAFPLVTWGSDSTISARDAYGYAASWAFVDRIAGAVGESNVARALRRVVTGVSAYDPVDADQLPLSGGRFEAVDSRRFLDQLTTAGGVDLGNSFGQVVLGPEAGPELRARHLARDDYAALLQAAGDWGAPDPIRGAMAAWRFDEARAAISAASAWLVERDRLIAKVARAGLTTPSRLARQFAAAGGGAAAQAELAAEVALVDAYLELQERARPRGPLETIGLLAADDPRTLLAAAGDAFAQGDLRGAAATLDAAEVQLNRATANGVVRLASVVVLLTVVYLLWSATSRRRGVTHYTGAR